FPAGAAAEVPVDLDGAYVLDTVGAIGGEEARVIDALDELYASARIQLFVVYVDNFTGSSNWANDTAVLNGLGANDVLLAVAIEERNYEISIDPDFPLSDAQVSAVETNDIEPRLREDDWAGAAIAAAQGFQASAVGSDTPANPDDSDTPVADSGGGIPILPILGGVAVVGVGVFLFSRMRRRSGATTTSANPAGLSQKQLDQRAGSLLVQLDDSIKTSEQELGFAIAQFGQAATVPFVAALASAKNSVSQAFALKQKLDDHQPDSAEEKRSWTNDIIRLCESADAELDSQADAFDGLRELERSAPEALAAATTKLETARATIAEATIALDTLSSTYAASAVAPVKDNMIQAEKLLAFAESANETAKASIAAAKLSDAAVAIRAAQASIGQVIELGEAVNARAASLAEASKKLEVLVADTKNDIAAARALPQDATARELPAAIAAAIAALETVSKIPADPITSLGAIESANVSLDAAFGLVRDEQAKIAKAKSQLEAAIAAARAQLSGAVQFITTRRGGVGEGARTRVNEAERRLAQAESLASSDPVAALAGAQEARELAEGAFALAEADARSFSSLQSTSSSAYSRGSQGADLGGLLGGAAGGMLGSGGGSGGGSRRSSSPSGGSSRTGRSASFGGSSRSATRSSGRSSGGRTSSGGRF
ncbi:MAG: TPM domain-containing protein, partial [Salinibacterium sp.]|nr:TPM domain-containing protein [Salinibacterium sp.]